MNEAHRSQSARGVSGARHAVAVPRAVRPAPEFASILDGARVASAPHELHGRWTLWKILSGTSNEVIRVALAADCLPPPTSAELDRRRAANHPPQGLLERPFTPKVSLYLKLLRLDRLAADTCETRRAVGILRTPRVRELVECSLLVNVSHATIATAAQQLLGVSLLPDAVGAFASLFFRIDAFTSAQLRVAVENRVRAELHKVMSAGTSRTTFTRALAADPRVVATTLPATPANWPLLLDAMGFPSNSASVRAILAEPA